MPGSLKSTIVARVLTMMFCVRVVKPNNNP
jgi:hypothetical protein